MEDNPFKERWGDEEDEALSLSDLPLIEKDRLQDEDINTKIEAENDEEFDFCSLSKESEMCAADEVFFQGQILPFRHSVSPGSGLLLQCCESMDHNYSGGLISSRSSSIGSGQSSSSSSSGRPRSRIQFHSHPTPSPRIRNRPRPTTTTAGNNFPRNSSLWSFLRVGLVTAPPEISYQDLRKSWYPGIGRSSGSRNSTGKKTKARRVSLFGGASCRGAFDAVRAVPSKVVTIKRRAMEGETDDYHCRIIAEPLKPARKQVSDHRTFEWLKQLSLEE